jgi:hypothetical protein
MIISKKSKLIKNKNRNIDDRGQIISIVDDKIKNVSIIECAPGSIRSNHYHLTDWHYMYVLYGRIDYFYKSIDSELINYLCVLEGNNVFTPPLEIHGTYFPIKTKLVVSSKNDRDQKTYENDTVRVNFIDSKNIDDMLRKYSQ